MITFDDKRCVHCNACVTACPNRIIANGPEMIRSAAHMCILCGHCYAVCPENAISVMGLQSIKTRDLPELPLIEAKDMLLFFEGRRSARAFLKKKVTKTHLKQILQAANAAPSASNAHLCMAHVYTDPVVIDTIREKTLVYYRKMLRLMNLPGMKKAASALGMMDVKSQEYYREVFKVLTQPNRKYDRLFRNAPALLAFSAPVKNEFAAADAFLCAQNAVIFAETIPIATCYNGFVTTTAKKDNGVKAAMKIPKNREVVTVLTLGYPKLKFARTAPRKPMETIWI